MKYMEKKLTRPQIQEKPDKDVREVFDQGLHGLQEYFESGENKALNHFLEKASQFYEKHPEAKVFLAGGAFRDLCLGKKVEEMNDLDFYMVTSDDETAFEGQEELMEVFKQRGLQPIKFSGEMVWNFRGDISLTYNPMEAQDIDENLFDRDFRHNSGAILIKPKIAGGKTTWQLEAHDPFGAAGSIQEQKISAIGIPENQDQKEFANSQISHIDKRLEKIAGRIEEDTEILNAETKKADKALIDLKAQKKPSQDELARIMRPVRELERKISGNKKHRDILLKFQTQIKENINNPEQLNKIFIKYKFETSPVRALRMVRQAFKLGENVSVDEATWQAAKEVFEDPNSFSKEQQPPIVKEILKAFQQDPMQALKIFSRLGALEYLANTFLPGKVKLDIKNFRQAAEILRKIPEEQQKDPRYILFALADALPDHAKKDWNALAPGISDHKKVAQDVEFMMAQKDLGERIEALKKNGPLLIEKLLYSKGGLRKDRIESIIPLNPENKALLSLPEKLPDRPPLDLSEVPPKERGQIVREARKAQLIEFFTN